MTKNYLPIGSIVLLKGASKRLMITGYCMIDETSNTQYDYCGCLYPEGMVDPSKMALFNHDQIEMLYFVGMQDNEELQFMLKVCAILDNKENNSKPIEPETTVTNENAQDDTELLESQVSKNLSF